MKHLFFLAFGFSFFFFSCRTSKEVVKIPEIVKLDTLEKEVLNLKRFSLKLMEKYSIPEDSLVKVQFYSPDSLDIILYPQKEKEIFYSILQDGTLNLNEKNKTRIVFQKKTPGVLKEFTVSSKTRKLDLIKIYLSEIDEENESDKKKFLTFRSNADSTGFVLVTKEHEGDDNVVRFGNEYYIVETKGKPIFLYCNIFKIEQEDVPSEFMKGKKVQNKP